MINKTNKNFKLGRYKKLILNFMNKALNMR